MENKILKAMSELKKSATKYNVKFLQKAQIQEMPLSKAEKDKLQKIAKTYNLPEGYISFLESYGKSKIKVAGPVDKISFFTWDKLESAQKTCINGSGKKHYLWMGSWFAIAKDTFGDGVYFLDTNRLSKGDCPVYCHLLDIASESITDVPPYKTVKFKKSVQPRLVASSFMNFIKILTLWVDTLQSDKDYNHFQSKLTKSGKTELKRNLNKIDAPVAKSVFWNTGACYDKKKGRWFEN